MTNAFRQRRSTSTHESSKPDGELRSRLLRRSLGPGSPPEWKGSKFRKFSPFLYHARNLVRRVDLSPEEARVTNDYLREGDAFISERIDVRRDRRRRA